MENILITIDNGFSARYFLSTKLIQELIIKMKGKLIIATHNNSELQYLEKEYNNKITVINFPEEPSLRFKSTILNYISIINAFGMPNDSWGSSTWLKNELYFKKNKIGYINRIFIKSLIKVYQNSNLLRLFIKSIHLKLLLSDSFKIILEKYKINLIILDGLSVISSLHPYWIKASKELNIKSVTIITNWDHASSKGYAGLNTSYYYVWGQSMEKELIKFQNISKDKIKILGSSLFDLYSKSGFIKSSLQIKNKQLPEKYILFITNSPTYNNNLKIVKYLREQIADEIMLVIRLHPSFLYESYDNRLKQHVKLSKKYNNLIYSFPSLENNTMATNMSFSEIQNSASLIAGAHIIINLGSTLILDSIICGRFIVNIIFDWNKIDQKSPLRPSLSPFRHHLSRAITHNDIYNIEDKNKMISTIYKLYKKPIQKFKNPLKNKNVVLDECGLINGNVNRRIVQSLYNMK